MSSWSHLTIDELQRRARSGDQTALLQLGMRVMDFNFCMHDKPGTYCEHLLELQDLTHQLENEIPPDCPHCGQYIDTPVQQPENAPDERAQFTAAMVSAGHHSPEPGLGGQDFLNARDEDRFFGWRLAAATFRTAAEEA